MMAEGNPPAGQPGQNPPPGPLSGAYPGNGNQNADEEEEDEE